MCKAFALDMVKENYGTIVNVQSPAGHIGFGLVKIVISEIDPNKYIYLYIIEDQLHTWQEDGH